MKTFSYTKSQNLVEELNKINKLRENLLLTPLSPREKLIFRWTANINHIYFSNALAGLGIKKEQIAELLSPIGKSNLTSMQKLIIGFKRALDHISQEWLVTTKPVDENTITNLYQIITNSKIKLSSQDLQDGLRYIQASPDHPLLQAALAQILIQTENFFGEESPQLGSLTSLLFLYKSGYDFRRFLVIEEYFYQQRDRYNKLINQSVRDTNVTPWLEFVVEAAEYQLNKLLRQINSREFEETEVSRALLEINERQKQILSSLDKPGSKISNKILQKNFKISAITAARDLAKLTSLRLLFPVGRGRSTYYTKA